MAIMRWEPRHMMRQVQGWDPFQELDFFGGDFRRMFDWPFNGKFFPGADGGPWMPRVDVLEDADGFQVRVDLPGMKKEEIHLTLDGTTLTIHGERKHESEVKSGDAYRQERFTGSFSRSLILPSTVDPQKIEATYKDGVLQVSMTKTEAARPKQIPIQS